MTKRLKVLLLFDEASGTSSDYETLMKTPDFRAEKDVYEALQALGHEVRLLGVSNDATVLLEELKSHRPDIVFNQVEQFNGDSAQEKNVIGLLEMFGLPFTGTGSSGLMICKNKALAKKILTHHRIKTPAFHVYPKGRAAVPIKKMKYPLIVKPLGEEASVGISMSSFVEDDKGLIERVRFVHDSLNQDVIAEEYVGGRELYVSALGNNRLKVFPPRELVFEEVPEDEPKIATYKAKWDDKYRKRWGIKNKFAVGLPEGVPKKIERLCKKVYSYLYLRGYARLDLRLTPENEVVFLEANPNPFIAKDEDFSKSAAKAGIEYPLLIRRILQYGLAPQG
ncbi:MAG TPA: ATP-grasp domain-containing protein [bacterium]|nr:ATP-grasp domain-containing protein [bacterium]